MRLHILESTSEVEPHVPEMEFPPDDSPSGWVYVHQQPLVIPDVNQETRWPKIMDVLKRNRVVSSCWLPLTTAQHRLGALMFGFVAGGPLESQLDFMRQVSAQVAVAVDNTLNFEKAEKYQRQLARERDRLQVLLEITNVLVSELDIRELFPQHHRLLAARHAQRILQPGAARQRRRHAKKPRAGIRRESGDHSAGSHRGAG